MKTNAHVWSYLAQLFLEWVEMKHNFIFNNFFFPENRTIYEIMWKNIVEPDRPQMSL